MRVRRLNFEFLLVDGRCCILGECLSCSALAFVYVVIRMFIENL